MWPAREVGLTIPRMIRPNPLASLSCSLLVLALGLSACGSDPTPASDETGTGETASESGTADEVGESGSSTTSTSDTNPDTESTTDDGSCPVGAEGCPCTGGGGCDPGLVCEGGTCAQPSETSTDTNTDTGTDTGTDTSTDTGTTDTGNDPMPYQACPNGEADCAPGEICVTGAANMGQIPWTMCTSGTCNNDGDCVVDDNDVCNDLPGDGEPIDYCVPQVCDFQNPCTDPMVCVTGFGGTSVCVWPLG